MSVTDMHRLVEMIVDRDAGPGRRGPVDRADGRPLGGVDSATVAALAVRAFGADKVVGVYTGIQSSARSRQLAGLRPGRSAFPCGARSLPGLHAVVEAARRSSPASACRFRTSAIRRSGPPSAGCAAACARRWGGSSTGSRGGIARERATATRTELIRFFRKAATGRWTATGSRPVQERGGELAAIWASRRGDRGHPSPDLWGIGAAHTDEGSSGR